jgi:hypothetical protein
VEFVNSFKALLINNILQMHNLHSRQLSARQLIGGFRICNKINISPSINNNEASNDSANIWTHHKDLVNQQNITGQRIKDIIDRE